MWWLTLHLLLQHSTGYILNWRISSPPSSESHPKKLFSCSGIDKGCWAHTDFWETECNGLCLNKTKIARLLLLHGKWKCDFSNNQNCKVWVYISSLADPTFKIIQCPLVPPCIAKLVLATRSRKLRKKLRYTDNIKMAIILKLQNPNFMPKDNRSRYKSSNMLVPQKAKKLCFFSPFYAEWTQRHWYSYHWRWWSSLHRFHGHQLGS